MGFNTNIEEIYIIVFTVNINEYKTRRCIRILYGEECMLVHAKALKSLRKHAYSNILKILPPKNENFQIKIQIFFLFLLKA